MVLVLHENSAPVPQLLVQGWVVSQRSAREVGSEPLASRTNVFESDRPRVFHEKAPPESMRARRPAPFDFAVTVCPDFVFNMTLHRESLVHSRFKKILQLASVRPTAFATGAAARINSANIASVSD